LILLTELSTRAIPPSLLADEQGVWRFTFDGDATYVDDNGAEFFWPIDTSIKTIRGVTVGTTNYLEVSTLAAVRSTEESFYWNVSTLYVHHADNANDYTIGTAVYRLLTASAGFASGRYPGQVSYYSNQYYDPIITNVGSLSKRVDPLKFGLLSFESSSYDLANADGGKDAFTNGEALNSQVRFFLMPPGETDVDNGTRIFTGYTGGARRTDETLTVQLQEARTFYNRSVCPNVFNDTDYASIDDKYIGKPIPVAYGKIRRGIAVPVDTASFDKSAGGTVTFKLADDSIHALTAVTALYDNNDNEVTIGTTDLNACTVTYSVPANADINLGQFSWEGQGYVIPGTYNNGLDIMKDAFVEQSELPYTADTFDTVAWDAATASNTASVGLSVQSDKGVIEEIVEPITVSLQGIVDVLGDGRISFRSRQPDAAISRAIYQDEIIGAPDFEIKTDEVVSSVVVEYSPSFVDRSSLSTEYTTGQDTVTALFAIKSSRPVSPVETVLTEEADALLVGAEIADTSQAPQEIVQIVTPLTTDVINLFDVIQVNVGRPQQADWRVYEVLERTVGLSNGELSVDLLLRLLHDREAVTEPWDEGLYSMSVDVRYNQGLFSETADTFADEGTI